MATPGLRLGTGWAELESSLREVDEPDALPAPCTRLNASTTRSPEGRTLLKNRRRKSVMTKCFPSIMSEGNSRGMTKRV